MSGHDPIHTSGEATSARVADTAADDALSDVTDPGSTTTRPTLDPDGNTAVSLGFTGPERPTRP